jgi:branched-subunit amino acid transport protein
MDRVWLTIVVAGVATFSMRAVFLAFAHRLAEVPPGLQRVLRQIPPAALAALIGPELLRPEGRFDLWQSHLLAGLTAIVVAWRTRSILLTLVVGMGLVALLTAFSR